MAVIDSNNMKSLLKVVYLNGVDNLKYQASPVLSEIKKEGWDGGKELRYAAQYGNGGNFGSDYSLISGANKTSGARNCEWVMGKGRLFGTFTMDQGSILNTKSDKAAYMKALNNQMAACMDGVSKTLAIYLYGGKYGVIDKVQAGASIIAGSNTLPLTAAGALKLDVGSRFQFASAGAANTAIPSSPLLTAVCTVTGIDDESVTFTSSAAVTIYAGDLIELYGSREGATAVGFEGLNDLIPTVANRTGAVWNNYIATPFRGVDRSQAVGRLAGQFVVAESGKNAEALAKLLKKVKRAGGIDDIIIINDDDFEMISKELDLQKTLWQATNSGNKKNSVTTGYSELQTAFGEAFIDRIVIDPYCPKGVAYMLKKDDLTFQDIGNAAVLDKVGNGQLGKVDIEAVGDAGFGDSFGTNINIDDVFTVADGGATSDGPVFDIAMAIRGNFLIRNTSACGAVVFNYA